MGGFDAGLSHCADWDLWIRLARRTDFVYLPEALVTYRQHGSNLSRQISVLERESVKVLQAAFADPATPEPLKRRRVRSMGRQKMVLAGCYFNAGLYRDFLRCTASALATDPLQLVRLAGFPYRRLTGTSDWRQKLP